MLIILQSKPKAHLEPIEIELLRRLLKVKGYHVDKMDDQHVIFRAQLLGIL